MNEIYQWELNGSPKNKKNKNHKGQRVVELQSFFDSEGKAN